MYIGFPLSGKGKAHVVRREIPLWADDEGRLRGTAVCGEDVVVLDDGSVTLSSDGKSAVVMGADGVKEIELCKRCVGVTREQRLELMREAALAAT